MKIIDTFSKRLDETVTALILLSKNFERLEPTHSDILCNGYPFSKSLDEVILDMLEWREKLNDLMEVFELGEEKNI